LRQHNSHLSVLQHYTFFFSYYEEIIPTKNTYYKKYVYICTAK